MLEFRVIPTHNNTFSGIPKGVTTRIRRVCSSDEIFEEQSRTFKVHLCNWWGYNERQENCLQYEEQTYKSRGSTCNYLSACNKKSSHSLNIFKVYLCNWWGCNERHLQPFAIRRENIKKKIRVQLVTIFHSAIKNLPMLYTHVNWLTFSRNANGCV